MTRPDRLSLDDERAIDAICVRYEHAAAAGDGSPPDFAPLLDEAPPHLRTRLRDELAALRDELLQAANDSSTAPPERIGGYRVLARLGQGGMGTVYEAVQEATRQRVALKVVRADMLTETTRRRFEREVRLLGSLRHPGIAQLFDAGVDESDVARPRPYFAMELIEGQPLLSHCERNRASVRERLELVRRVANAVQHAHDHGVVHRDLKPANILVLPPAGDTTVDSDGSGRNTSTRNHTGSDLRAIGRPKIVDFGVARAVGRGDGHDLQQSLATHTSQIVGTISHMSPEQLEHASVDGRADVYALGVILYQLLAGRLPIDIAMSSLPAAIDSIRGSEPTPLGAIDPRLRGDVEVIVQKALEKDPSRRYQTASALADDLGRHLEDVPILARPTSARDRLRKFARRNRGLFQGLLATGAVLVLSLVVVSWFAWQQVCLRQQAETRERQKEGVSDFLRDMLRRANLDRAGNRRGTTLYDVLVAAEQEIDAAFADDPASRAAVRLTIGDAFWSQGEFERARTQLQLALAAAREVHRDDAPEIADVLNVLAKAHEELADYDEAERLFRRVVAIRTQHLGRQHDKTLAARHNLASLLEHRGDLDQAEAEHLALLACEQTPEDRSLTLNNLGAVLEKQGRLGDAERHYRESLQIRERLYTAPNRRIATAMHNLGILLWRLRRLDEATPLFEEAARQRELLFDPGHPEVLGSKTSLAAMLRDRGEPERAADLLAEVTAATAARMGEHHPNTEAARLNQASVLRTCNRIEAARDLSQAALASLREQTAAGDPLQLLALKILSRCENQLGNLDRAEELYRERLTQLRDSNGDHPETISALLDLAGFHAARARELATSHYRDAVATADRLARPDRTEYFELESRKLFARHLADGEQRDEALQVLAEIASRLADYAGSDKQDYASFVAELREQIGTGR